MFFKFNISVNARDAKMDIFVEWPFWVFLAEILLYLQTQMWYSFKANVATAIRKFGSPSQHYSPLSLWVGRMALPLSSWLSMMLANAGICIC